jgi:NADPH2:quinone reductase
MESVGGEVFGQALLKLGTNGLLLWYGQASMEPARANFFAVRGNAVLTLPQAP